MTASPEELAAQVRALVAAALVAARYGETEPVSVSAFHVGGEPVPLDVAAAQPFAPFAVGDAWGPRWDTTWFRVRGRIPARWYGEEVVLRFEHERVDGSGAGGELLVFRAGVTLAGLSPEHPYLVVTSAATGPEPVDLLIEGAANPGYPPHFAGEAWPLLEPDFDGPPQLRLARAELAVRRLDVAALVTELELAAGLMQSAPHAEVRDRAAHVCAAALAAFDPGDLETLAAARAALRPLLQRASGPGAPTITAIGHAHLDTAWLWPVRETRRKAARSVATAISLMRDHPEYRFAVPAAQHLAFVAEDHPELFARARAEVEAGRLVPVGGMWVESDANLPSGESLLRQLVHGQRWFEEQVGRRCTEMWIPDVFGYPASLPGIMAAAGIRRFVTQKLSWNDTNRFPYHTFWWEGLDGTRVLTHFPPADTYNGVVAAPELVASTTACASEPYRARSLYIYGHGDGGGGPTRDHLEALRRVRDLDGIGRVRQGTPASFFDGVLADGAALPVWVGELYLEKHRGTLTSQGAIKAANRRNESLLAAAELWAAVQPGAADRWPAARLDRAWKQHLVLQFHDILPGSSIRWVYEDAARDAAVVANTTSAVASRARRAIAAAVDAGDLADPVCVFNDTPFDRVEVVDVAGRGRVVRVPAHGYTTIDAGRSDAPDTDGEVEPLTIGPDWVENRWLRVTWDDAGQLRSIWDREAEREVLDGPGNVLHLVEDRPADYDAWDIDDPAPVSGVDAALETASSHVLEAGPLRLRLTSTRRFGSSTLRQVMTMSAVSRVLRFDTAVDWHEDHRLLKVAFPLTVRAPAATFEIQFGHVARPTHRNTSWDRARFEVCAHRWADLSEAGYGVALLNDGKYGHDVTGSLLRLSLLRAPTAPDPRCDRGRHHFAYGLLPHLGDLAAGGVVAAGCAFGSPLRLVPTRGHGTQPPSRSFVAVDDPGVVVDTVKRADDGNGLILRCYEAWGGRRRARIRLPAMVERATRVDACERPLDRSRPLEHDRDGVVVELGPFELATLRVSTATERAHVALV